MLEKVLPHALLKAGPNLESRIKTLKKDWAIVNDMFNGKDNSSFGWDEHRVIKKLVNLDIAVSLIMTNLLPSMQKIEPQERYSNSR
ncbi:hypothetical protein Goshw_027538 [Gossypium schwendimanii]|uniref:Myb/SANT-like domain-containing protein n=1 Tax=Gossypium schwendimanii TaxID=34291 RepID=A0A7J9L6D8_GOSSC|nr:hypothetical protein [Gossypium schwendimanii]